LIFSKPCGLTELNRLPELKNNNSNRETALLEAEKAVIDQSAIRMSSNKITM